MCGMIGMIGTSLLSAGMSMMGGMAQEQAAYDAQVEQNNIAIMQNNEQNRIKNNNAVMNYEQLANKEIEVGEQAADEKGKVAKEARKRRAEQRVASSANGSTSATINKLLGETYSLENSDKNTIQSNLNAQKRSIDADRKATQMNAEPTKLFLTEPTKPSGLSLLTGAVSGVTGALSSYSKKRG